MEQYVSGERHKEIINSGPTKRRIGTPVVLVIIGVLLLAVGFAGGVGYQKGRHNTVATPRTGNVNGPGTNGGLGRFSGRRGTLGQVTAVSDSSITVQDSRSGSNTSLSITSTTQITNNGAAVTASSIQVGDTVLVRASPTDPSQAARITVNPSFGGASPASPSSNATGGGTSQVLTN